MTVRAPVAGIDAHRHFVAHGFAALGDLWGSDLSRALADEARALSTQARSPGGRRVRPAIVPSRSGDGPSSTIIAPVLSDLHESLRGLARALSGRMLVPSYAVYNYYDSDDAVWLHVDSQPNDVGDVGRSACEMTLVVGALGEVGPLHVHPDLSGLTLEELEEVESADSWNPDSGLPVSYPEHGVLALSAQRIPHHRPARRVESLCAVAALHYSSFF